MLAVFKTHGDADTKVVEVDSVVIDLKNNIVAITDPEGDSVLLEPKLTDMVTVQKEISNEKTD